jgi:hypothetical protein
MILIKVKAYKKFFNVRDQNGMGLLEIIKKFPMGMLKSITGYLQILRQRR